MLLQITYQDKATQTEKENPIEEILKAITTLCIKVDSTAREIQKLNTNEDNLKSEASTSQQHDYENAELSRSKDFKNPELKGDIGKHLKTHNICLNTAAGTSKQRNANLNQLFEKPYTQKAKNSLTIKPQTLTYGDSLQHEKKIMEQPSDIMDKQEAKHTETERKLLYYAILMLKPVRRGSRDRGVNKVEALIRRKYLLKYDASSDRKT
ncbi:hypothetical protein H5410_002162 [Solanum commersonii]|uniref:Uncharacterized protein n=1 Tax=Solanum commersonii TaxID=4109 RepID=A0A9J6B0X4_SOLCO|nr:hypothetical protein H5410_002162 [Solanum commersonii]